MKKSSEAQVRASRKWEKNNPEKTRYIRSRTGARTFARKYAKQDDMIEVLQIFINESENYDENFLKKLKKLKEILDSM